jgi:hypothetical protein
MCGLRIYIYFSISAYLWIHIYGLSWTQEAMKQQSDEVMR